MATIQSATANNRISAHRCNLAESLLQTRYSATICSLSDHSATVRVGSRDLNSVPIRSHLTPSAPSKACGATFDEAHDIRYLLLIEINPRK